MGLLDQNERKDMNTHKRRLSVLLIMMLLISSISMGVFADDEATGADPQNDPAQVEQGTETETDFEANEAGSTDEQGEEQVEEPQASPEPAAVESVTIEKVEAQIVAIDETSSKCTVKVTWTGNGGEAFTVEAFEAGSENAAASATAAASPAELTLDLGKTYSFKVTSGETSAVSEDVTTPARPSVPEAVNAYSGAACVKFKWKPVDNVSGYIVYRDGNQIAEVDPSATEYIDKVARGESHFYTVAAFTSYDLNGSAYTLKSDKSKAYKQSPVRPMYYKLTIKSNYKSLKLKKGDVVYADRFDSGKYMLLGSGTYVKRTYAKKRTADYIKSGGWNYSREDAETYVNTKYPDPNKKGSPTNHLIWVSTYTQHVYYFARVDGQWKCKDDWECATGTASTPTPTGKSYNKAIWKKMKKYHGLKWWSCFSSMNSFHGKQSKWKVGTPASNGCVRNPNNKAEFIYKTVPKKTQVIIF